MYNLNALAELIMISDQIVIQGNDYRLQFKKVDAACDSPPEGGMIEFGFKHHTKTLFADDITKLIWNKENATLIIYEERK